MIAAGRVSVNGEIAGLGRRVETLYDRVELDGALVPASPALVYYLLNKPRGVVSTARDPGRRTAVLDLVPPSPRVFPVGRLDVDTEGLLVLTNDGDLAHRVMHPSHGVEKEYLAEVLGTPSRKAVRLLSDGVDLEDGRTAPAKVRLVSPGVLKIVVHEGRKRQVRRMCAAVGHPVVRLVRTRIGPIADPHLAPGKWRSLEAVEVHGLAAAAAGSPRGPYGSFHDPAGH